MRTFITIKQNGWRYQANCWLAFYLLLFTSYVLPLQPGLSQGTWSPIADFIDSLENGVGIGLGDKGYVGLGDSPYSSAKNDWWEYNPSTDSWTQMANFPGTARIKATAFAIDNMAYVGLGAAGGMFGYNTFYKYDPGSNSWTQIANFPGPQRYTVVSFSVLGKGYVGTGAAATPFETYYKDFYEYDPMANTWTKKADFGGVKRRHAMGFAIGCKGYLGCGWDMSAFAWYQDFWEYDPVTDAWTQKANFPQTTEGGVGFSMGNKGYIGHGESSSGQHDEFWEYDPNSNSWTAIPDYPGGQRNRSVAFVIDSFAFVGTGNGPDTIYSDFYMFTPDDYDTNIVCCAMIITETKVNETCGNGNGTATVTQAGGTSPFTYQWSNGATSSTATGLSAGVYFYTVTESAGCQWTDSVLIANSGVNVAAAAINATDSLTCDGEGTAIASGGTPPYTYAWGPSAGNQTTSTATGLCDGTYIVTVTDNNSCSDTATVVISWPKCFTITSAVSHVSCNGGSDGAADISIGSGTPPYTYQWSNSATTEDVSALAAGIYTVTVTSTTGGGNTVFWNEDFTSGAGGWTLNTNGPGTNGNIPNFWVANSTPGCGCGSGNYLHITCDATGLGCTSGDCVYNDTPPFPPFFPDDPTSDKLSMSPVISTVGQTGITLKFKWMSDGATANDYCKLRLSDDGGSTWNELATEYSGATVCGQESITLASNYENQPDFRIAFRWVNAANGNGSDPPFGVDDIELSVNTTASSCSVTQSVTITEPNPFNLNNISKGDETCSGSADGTATANIGGATTPYTFLWSNSQTGMQATGLTAGTYTVTITDANGCTTSASFNINSGSLLTVTASSTPASCGGTDGGATSTTSGGTAPYTFLWSGGQTTQNISGLAAGTYTVTINDSKGCSGTASTTVATTGGPALSVNNTSPLCSGGTDGTATVTASGGTLPYTWVWNTGATTSTINLLPSSIYTVTVTDGAGCITIDSTVITEPTAVSLTVTDVNATCGNNDGSANAAATGGTGTITYQWSTGASASAITGLGGGTYTVTVTDGNGCTESQSITILSIGGPSIIPSTVQNVTCSGSNDGMVTVTASGGTQPYTYLWSNLSTATLITGLGSGTYTVTVTDANNCAAIDSAVVTEPAAVALTMNKVDASCGNSDGSATVTASGGTLPYSYSWNTGGTGSAITGIPSGNYTVTVTDNNGCTGMDIISVNDAGAATVSVASQNNVSCYGGSDGSLTWNVTGGTPPYSYQWSNGGSQSSATGLQAGNYLVTVTDNAGCKGYANTTITEPAALTVTMSSTDANCIALGTASVTAGGGSGSYTYQWSNAATSATLSGLNAGTFTVTVSDANGCTVTDATTINQTGSITANIAGIDEVCAGETAMLVATGGTSYWWINGVTNDTLLIAPSATYTYFVVASQGSCRDTAWHTVVVNPVVQVDAGNDTTVYFGESATLTGTVTGGTSPFTYDWSTGENTASITVLPTAGREYFITVTDSKGCTTRDSVYVDILPCDAEVFVPNIFAPDCKCPDDRFRVYSDCIKSLEVRIFDRWGEKVFEIPLTDFSTLTTGSWWNGTFHDKPMDAAVYVYILKYTTVNKPDEEVVVEGNVHLMR